MTVTRSQAAGPSSVPGRPDQGGPPPPATGPAVESTAASVPALQAGAEVAVPRGLPPPAGGAAPSVPALPAGAAAAVPAATIPGGLPPSAAGPSMVIPDILPPPPQLPADTQGMMALLQQMLQTQRVQAEAQQRQTEVLRQTVENSHQLAMAAVERGAPTTVEGAPAQQQGQRRPGTHLDFRKMGPRDFRGTEGILYADDWLEDVQRCLELAEVPRALWVASAASQFFDIALTWYRTDPRASVRGISWEDFRKLFKEKFYPDVALTALEGQFVSLVQGSSSVDEYAAEFFRLSRFAPGLIQDEGCKARKFRRGLIHAVRTRTSGRRDATFEQILMEAQIAEEDFGLKPKRGSDVLGASSSTGPAKRPYFQQRQFQQQQPQLQFQQAPGRAQQHQGQRQRPAAQCNYCGKIGHTGEVCRLRLGVCLFCGAPGHQMKDCAARAARQAGQDRVRQARGGQQGRVFAMAVEPTQAVAEQSADDLEGDCPTYHGIRSDGLDLDRVLVVEPLDFAHPE
ncbi:uncharacterized protein M6B38_328205 [Iris pallida]|uniref:CCHC-type domain-containing protein n=1 Tax=Iris pallida TaxID=29817 RepID=A0AAX6H700_IRIPA|nr:uncharacterized protein M6B38_333075 [Iris pallida]KAJ6836367.1 uncharacterized protein M6B38_328205 [Iris pallida]